MVGVATYHGGGALRGYTATEANLVWTLGAVVAGLVMGLSGALITSRRTRPPIAAVAAPSAMLVAEAIFFVIDRRVWPYDLTTSHTDSSTSASWRRCSSSARCSRCGSRGNSAIESSSFWRLP